MISGERLDGETPRSPGDPQPFPHVPGYQKVGAVEWVGAAVPGLHVGASVFASVSKVDHMFYPFAGHVSPAVTHHSQIWTIPPSIRPLAFSALVLTQVGYNCATRPLVHPGDAVVVVGDGLIGQWAAQLLVHRGAHVMLVGKHHERLCLFALSQHDRAVNLTREDPVAIAREWTTDGMQALIDTVGSVSSIEAFLPVMRRDGHVVSAGFHGTRGLIDIQHLRFRELSLHAPSGWTRPRMDATRDLIERGVLHTERLITHHFPVTHAAEAFAMILSRHEAFLGVILDWTSLP